MIFRNHPFLNTEITSNDHFLRLWWISYAHLIPIVNGYPHPSGAIKLWWLPILFNREIPGAKNLDHFELICEWNIHLWIPSSGDESQSLLRPGRRLRRCGSALGLAPLAARRQRPGLSRGPAAAGGWTFAWKQRGGRGAVKQVGKPWENLGFRRKNMEKPWNMRGNIWKCLMKSVKTIKDEGKLGLKQIWEENGI